jgi:hypothetical protein
VPRFVRRFMCNKKRLANDEGQSGWQSSSPQEGGLSHGEIVRFTTHPKSSAASVKKMRYGRDVTNKWFYRERTRRMPRMRNLEPYASNEIAKWFARLYDCDEPTGRWHFDSARSLSRKGAKADPARWPAFLVFDHDTREWHGIDVP